MQQIKKKVALLSETIVLVVLSTARRHVSSNQGQLTGHRTLQAQESWSAHFHFQPSCFALLLALLTTNLRLRSMFLTRSVLSNSIISRTPYLLAASAFPHSLTFAMVCRCLNLCCSFRGPCLHSAPQPALKSVFLEVTTLLVGRKLSAKRC